MKQWIGIDIGGANLKLATAAGQAVSRSFPLWKQPDRLGAEIGRLLDELPVSDGLAVTMTGELADCYQTREEGVCRILDQVTSVFPAIRTRVYAVGGSWLLPSAAARDPWKVAASNWHAMAQFALPLCDRSNSLLIDLGSTTCDIIPIVGNRVATDANSDSERLIAGQLVYTGMRRTPLCAVVSTLPLHGEQCPVMAELFATIDDVHLILGHVAEDPEDVDTADGRPRTQQCAEARLARMVGEDHHTLSRTEIRNMASFAFRSQVRTIAAAIQRNRTNKKSDGERVVIVGHGRSVIEAALEECRWSPELLVLEESLGPELSRVGPAYAVAKLAQTQVELPLPAESAS